MMWGLPDDIKLEVVNVTVPEESRDTGPPGMLLPSSIIVAVPVGTTPFTPIKVKRNVTLSTKVEGLRLDDETKVGVVLLTTTV